MERLNEYYPKNEYMVCNVRSRVKIADYLQSRSVTAWGQGPVGRTGYYLLASVSPRQKGDRVFVIVAKNTLVNEVIRRQEGC